MRSPILLKLETVFFSESAHIEVVSLLDLWGYGAGGLREEEGDVAVVRGALLGVGWLVGDEGAFGGFDRGDRGGEGYVWAEEVEVGGEALGVLVRRI